MRWLCLILALAVGKATAVENLDFRVVGKLPHSRSDFTQGLEIRDGRLYQSTGGYGQSRLQVFDLASGKLLREHRLPRYLFGEGLTLLEDRVVQLTWRAGRGLVYRLEDFEPLEQFPIPGEGWGVASNGQQLVYSDGSATLRFLSPEGWRVTRELQVTRNGKPLRKLNELEWTPQGILANIYRRDVIVRIDPESGAVTGEINLKGLLPRSERRSGKDILNGIARDPADGSLWVTGKNWPWLYRLRLLEPEEQGSRQDENWEAPGKNH